MTLIIILLIIFLLLLCNHTFVLIMSPVMALYERVLRKHKRSPRVVAWDAESLSAEPSPIVVWLKRYAAGFERYFLHRVALTPSHRLRDFVYRNVCLMSIAPRAVIYAGADIRAPYNIEVGRGSIIGDNAVLDGRNGISIGKNVNFSSNVSVWTEQHDHEDPLFRCWTKLHGRTVVADRAWVGPNVILLPGIKIGEGAVVAGGAVVTKDVEPYTIVAGIPAKKIGERTRDLKYEFDGQYLPFL